MSYKRFFIWLLSLLACLPGGARVGYTFKHITAANGLPDNYVAGVFFLPDGRLGIRTSALLSFYDGCKYTSFPYDVRQSYYWEYDGIPLFQYVDSKKDLVWIKERDVLRVFDLEHERYVQDIDSLLQDFGVEGRLSNMFIDDAGRHWFVSGDGKLQVYVGGQLQEVAGGDADADNGSVISLNGHGELCWIVYGDGTLRCWNIARHQFVCTEREYVGRIRQEDRVVLRVLADGCFWMMWDRGVAYYDQGREAWVRFDDLRQDAKDVFTTLDTDSSGNAYVGTGMSGLYIISNKDFSVVHYPDIPLMDGSTIHNDITNIAVNRMNDDVWIAFMFQGLAYHYSHMNKFALFNKETLKGELPQASIRSMAETADGRILLGTLDGLHRFDPRTGRVDLPFEELAHKLCLTLYRDSRNRIWAGTLYDGLYCIEEGRIVRQYYTSGIEYQVFQREANYNMVRSVMEDKAGNLWVPVPCSVS